MNKHFHCAVLTDDALPDKRRLAQAFWRLGPAFTRWTESLMTEAGLTPQRVRLMSLLLEHGPTMMRDLRDALGVTATNITALVDALEKDGMVERTPHPADRRATLVALTPAAVARIRENCPAFQDRVAELFDDFSEAERDQFLALLEKMRTSLVARGVLQEHSELAKAKVSESA